MKENRAKRKETFSAQSDEASLSPFLSTADFADDTDMKENRAKRKEERDVFCSI